MGASSNKQDESDLHDYERFGTVRLQQVRKINPDHTSTIQSFMKFSVTIENEKLFTQWQESINRVNDSESQEILLLPREKKYESLGFCGSGGNIQLTFDNFPYTLETEIKNRKRMEKSFTETEMWYLFYNMIRAGNKFQKMSKKIGDVNPKNIVINQNGQVRLIALCSLPNQTDNFQKIVDDISAPVFLAPEQLSKEFIDKGEYPPSIDHCRAEIFSIGMTILGAGVLENCFKLYETPFYINQVKVNDYLRILQQKYSPFLFKTICSTLIFPPYQREKASEIYNKLYKYENQILDLEPFQLNESTVTIKQRPKEFEVHKQLKSTSSQPTLIRSPVISRSHSPKVIYQHRY